MKKTDVLLAIERLKQAVARLEDALGRVRDDLDRDGAIQRFEFTVELLWKTLAIQLEYQGITCQSPRNCIKLAFRHGLIEDDELLLDMIEDRNRSSHVYNEKTAEEIFTRISKLYAKSIRQVLERLESTL
ncbi:MAG: nucleotidyltransferase [Gammaproteobacteria bacterium]|nr:MAG: nucleotidyltransferase [Gammaproteobacteria bacterium]